MFQLLDQDGNNSISRSEFENRFFKPEEEEDEDTMEVFFNALDTNEDGVISNDELSFLLINWRDGTLEDDNL